MQFGRGSLLSLERWKTDYCHYGDESKRWQKKNRGYVSLFHVFILHNQGCAICNIFTLGEGKGTSCYQKDTVMHSYVVRTLECWMQINLLRKKPNRIAHFFAKKTGLISHVCRMKMCHGYFLDIYPCNCLNRITGFWSCVLFVPRFGPFWPKVEQFFSKIGMLFAIFWHKWSIFVVWIFLPWS